jgi:hypothetical protein
MLQIKNDAAQPFKIKSIRKINSPEEEACCSLELVSDKLPC